MSIDLVTRREWGAREPHGAYGSLASTKGVKIHYTGGHEKPEMLDDHKLCTLRVRAIQNQHIDGNGWIDVGYSLLVCPHRKVFEGRGLKHLPAANGAGLNSGHYAVLGLVGDSGLTEPNDDMLHGIVDAIEYLRAKGGAGTEVKGHRDGFATDCPGGPLYAWVKAGAPRPNGTPTKPASTPTEEAVKDLPLLKLGAGKGKESALCWDVKTMFYLLHARGFSVAGGVDDTVFSGPVEDALKAFQREKKLDDDGICGIKSWTSLLRL